MSAELVSRYVSGPPRLVQALRGMSEEQIRARPVPGKWSTLELVCHVADMEGVFSDRIKRVLAEEAPPLQVADENLWAAKLRYHERSLAAELDVLTSLRRQLAPVLTAASPEEWRRCGIHSVAGAVSLEQLVEKAVSHLEHHQAFITEKRRALGLS